MWSLCRLWFCREGEKLENPQHDNSEDIDEALSDSQLMNDSRADTTLEGEITQDSIQELVFCY